MNLQEKKLEFIAEVHTSALNKYQDEMILDFIEYWTETDRRKKKMRFESQKFFSMGRRLSTWARNDKKWNAPKILNTQVRGATTITERLLNGLSND
ncbi:hypothetical protein [Flagellimonas sp. CMM7]|uniref:hypothetical protein n=1 Tax=Flagellimonas sp. CMM7 TaxID=2654676 RepID=UPI0013D5B26A|nr:hypothetical protein [Flagellimonas sp. CMM7]UII80041.1 hypothetical protein LV704_00620 [Flagellimonas sp. CMM7]